jgi:hypothetical protein
MKLFNHLLLRAAMSVITINSFAQSGSSNQTVPELVFENSVLISGTAGSNGAEYRFPTVTTGIDAIIKIRRRSDASVTLTNIDVSNLGWSKAFQPQLGIVGNVPANQNWWMEFEVRFVETGTLQAKRINNFVVTSLDVDGDNASISEYTQMNGITSAEFCPVTYLQQRTPMTLSADDNGKYAAEEKCVFVQGPQENFTDIDISATSVMATYTYQNKEAISFFIGAKSTSVISNAGERLNCMWFKSFSLAQQRVLPLRLTSFNAVYDAKNVVLDWTTDFEKDFSHFIIERSLDGKNFKEVALVFSNGDAEQKTTYRFKDAIVNSPDGTLLYRLRFVENSKETYYSQIRVVRLQKEQNKVQISTFPNPAADQVTVSLPALWQGKTVAVELFNANGSRVQNLQLKNAGSAEILKLNNLPRGFYVVQATCNNETAQQRIVKN